MAQQSTDSLVQSAACINNCIPGRLQNAVLIYLFAQIAGISVANTDALVQAAACINNCIPPGMQTAVLIYLALQISGGGVGGGAQIVTSDPQGSLLASRGAMVFNTNDSTLWINTNGTINGWQQLI